MNDPLVEKAAIGVAGLLVAWGGWITRLSLKHENMLTRLETKLDLLIDHFGVKPREKS